MPSAELTYQTLPPLQAERRAIPFVVTPDVAPRENWINTVLAAARRWFFLPLVLGLIGGLTGYAVGSVARPGAETLLRAQSAAVDGAGIKVSVNSVVTELDTADLYEQAARSTGGSATELRDRTRISALPESQIVSISVTSSSPEQAVKEVDALAAAALGANETRVNAELSQLTDQTRELIADRKLTNLDAERARLARLGDSLGANQSALTVGARQLVLIQSGKLSRMLPSPMLLGAMGFLGGAMLGLAGAILLGTRRGTIRSVSRLQQLYPQASVIEPGDIDDVLELESSLSAVYVGTLGQKGADHTEIADRLRQLLTSRDGRTGHVDPNTEASPPETGGMARVMPVELSPMALRRIARHEDAVLVVAVPLGDTRVRQLDALAANLPERTYLLAVERSASWA